MDEINKCPFCGGEARLHQETDNSKVDHTTLPDGAGSFTRVKAVSYVWYIRCKRCGARSLPFENHLFQRENGEICIDINGRKEAIEAWNRRATE